MPFARRNPDRNGRGGAFYLALPLILGAVAGCGGSPDRATPAPTPAPTQAPAPAPRAVQAQFRSADLSVRLIGVVGAEQAKGAQVPDPGWLEYLLEVENRGTRSLTVHNVKLLTPEGRYLDSAADYAELAAPPDTAKVLAQDVAVRSVGIAAGQVIPYGGTIVGLLSGVASASSAQAQANARREFALRKIKEVELAPGGRMTGSAFLPRIQNPKALILDWGRGNDAQRAELPL
jgi:hypothetical protein